MGQANRHGMTFDATLPVEYPPQTFLDGFHLLELVSAT